jgi:signal transduction histidine kinase/CheY-like chemotaxis protein/HPt (histidine-containing phosphotransfer) domain-containing protein
MLRNFANNSLRWYYISIYLGLALVFGSQYFTFKNVRDLSLNNESLNVTIGILNQTAHFGLIIKDFQSNMRGYLITKDEELLLDNYNRKVQLVEISDTLFNLVRRDSLQTTRVRELLVISGDIVAFAQDIVAIYRTQGQEKAFEKIREGTGKRLNYELTTKIKEIDDYEKANLNERRELVSGTQQNSFLFIFITSLVGILLLILAIILSKRDRRRRLLLQKEIKEKERLLTQYLEAIPDGVMVINPQKEIVLLNQSGRELLNIRSGKLNTLDEELGHLKMVDPTRYNIRFTPQILPVTRGLEGEKLIGNKIDLIKNNTIYHLETNVQPIVGLDGEITSAITVFRDITERANYEATLEKARLLAEKSVHVKDIFLSNVSHEIRTPLNAIIGFTNLLMGEVRDAKSLEYVGYIQYAGKNLLELINDILDFSKIEAGQIYLEKTVVSMEEVVKSVSVIINQRAGEKAIAYECMMSEDLPEFVETDKLRLTQILLNVCGNAVKFTEKGGVTMLVEPTGPVVDGVQQIRFQVKDTGIGIEKDKINDVFNRFVQATDSTTRIFGGTGLGLSIVKSLVQIFEGTLNLESEIGKGSTFTMDFPMKVVNDAVLVDELDEIDKSVDSIATMRVLAAEDNVLNQKLLSAIFERMKIALTIVNNGQEAIDTLRTGDFDLVLMDIQMPVMDGYTAIKEIRRSISTTIPIITMTAHAMVGEKEECLSIGANSYISKPFKESELLTTMARLGNKENIEVQTPKTTLLKTTTEMPDGLLNFDYLTEITGGDLELRDELISLFENDSKTQLDNIANWSEKGDLEQLRLSIHKFRSSLFSVGLLPTANRYKELEASLKQGDWNPEANQKLVQLASESEKGLFLLKQL